MKLNLGCGENYLSGYVNVDKYGTPDVVHDLETFPWPWDDGSVGEIVFNHVLEHLGERADVYLKIIQELYRICRPGATIRIVSPHPRHDDFINDPTHIRVITPEGFWLFSKRLCKKFVEKGAANSPLALYLDVDFEVENVRHCLEEPYAKMFDSGEMTVEQLNVAVKRYNNVVKEMEITLKRI